MIHEAAKLLELHPPPWFIDQMNPAGVVVKDTRGNSVFEEWFGEAPPEISSAIIDDYIAGRCALARFLVAWASSANQ